MVNLIKLNGLLFNYFRFADLDIRWQEVLLRTPIITAAPLPLLQAYQIKTELSDAASTITSIDGYQLRATETKLRHSISRLDHPLAMGYI